MRVRLALIAAAALASAGCAHAPEPAYVAGAADVARTNRAFPGDDDFAFVVLGDRTGRHRPGVFEAAIDRVEALHPDFVINIGDLIEGNTEDRALLSREWDEIEAFIGRLGIPFFHVPGNHDLTNPVQLTEWRERFGAPYYSFTYKDVLFLVLDTEDPPQAKIARTPLVREYGAEAMGKVMAALQDPDRLAALVAAEPRLAELARKIVASENVAFSAEQLAMVHRALADNPSPRWTFVLFHRPAWKVDSPAFREIEAMLAGRPYTVFAGHYHKYAYEGRAGRDYIQLGTTGGMPGGAVDDPNVVDHVMWVAMTGDAPRISNIRLDGLFGRRGPGKD
ncbi:MAG: metallophosphoesterase [Novosphingobium sp.]|nr:metallophosphoesterase [Novosphingobium sp.]